MSDVIEPTTSTAIAVIRTALPTILAADKTDILGKLAAKVAAFKPDVSTATGRDEMRSLAYEIAKNKTALVKIGKGLTEEARAMVKNINAECNVIEDRMDELRDRVRAPLTAWENREKERVAAHETALAAITEAAHYGQQETVAELSARLDYLMNYPARDWQEFTERANAALVAETDRTAGLLAAAQKREAEAAELERLRAAEAERQRLATIEAQRVREEQIVREAAERATREAEAKAAREAAEREQAIQREREAAARREQEQRDAVEQSKRALEAQKAHAKAEAERAERDQSAAVEAERRRLERIAAEAEAARQRQAEAERAEAERRAANVAHRKRINGEALADMILAISEVHAGSSEYDEAACKAVITAIAKGSIRHVAIGY